MAVRGGLKRGIKGFPFIGSEVKSENRLIAPELGAPYVGLENFPTIYEFQNPPRFHLP